MSASGASCLLAKKMHGSHLLLQGAKLTDSPSWTHDSIYREVMLLLASSKSKTESHGDLVQAHVCGRCDSSNGQLWFHFSWPDEAFLELCQRQNLPSPPSSPLSFLRADLLPCTKLFLSHFFFLTFNLSCLLPSKYLFHD